MGAVHYSDKEYTEILLEIDEILKEAEKSPFQTTKDIVESLSKYLDLLHREPLTRLMKLIEANHPELKTKMEADYTIKTMFKLYDLFEGEIEKSPLSNTVSFVPDDELGLLPPIIKSKKS